MDSKRADELNALREKGLAKSQSAKFNISGSSFLTPEEAENYLSQLKNKSKNYKPPKNATQLSSNDLNDWYAQQKKLDLEEKKRREEAEAFLRGYRSSGFEGTTTAGSGNGNTTTAAGGVVVNDDVVVVPAPQAAFDKDAIDSVAVGESLLQTITIEEDDEDEEKEEQEGEEKGEEASEKTPSSTTPDIVETVPEEEGEVEVKEPAQQQQSSEETNDEVRTKKTDIIIIPDTTEDTTIVVAAEETDDDDINDDEMEGDGEVEISTADEEIRDDDIVPQIDDTTTPKEDEVDNVTEQLDDDNNNEEEEEEEEEIKDEKPMEEETNMEETATPDVVDENGGDEENKPIDETPENDENDNEEGNDDNQVKDGLEEDKNEEEEEEINTTTEGIVPTISDKDMPDIVKEEVDTVGSESTPSDSDKDDTENSVSWRRWISNDPGEEFQPEAGRYHLYVSHACPYAHRVMIVLALKGLQETIGVTYVHPTWQYTSPDTDEHRGWVFGEADGKPFSNTNGFGKFPSNWGQEDPHNVNNTSIRGLYELANDTTQKYTVPVLWCTKQKTIVNNRSNDIIRILNAEFNDFAKNPKLDLCPEEKKEDIDNLNEWLHRDLNEGVYNCGLAVNQVAYDLAIDKLTEAFDRVEFILQKQRYLLGESITEADVRLFVTLFRFDEIYHVYFKASSRSVSSTPTLMKFVREIYRMEGVEKTCDMKMIKAHYYTSHVEINKYAIIPRGDDFVALLKSST